MRKSSIVLKSFKDVQVHYFYHNSREKPTSNSIFDINNNYTNKTSKESIKSFYREFSIRSKKYTERTGKKLPSNTIKHISGIFNITETTTDKQIKEVIKYLEDTLGTKIIQYSKHLDEGFKNKNGEEKINYHVHLEMIGLDENGWSIRKKLTRQYLRNLQTKVAEILNMERGQDVRKTKKKRLDTYQYKIHRKLMDEELKQKNEMINKLQKENEELKQKIKKLEPTKQELGKYIKMTKELRKTIKEINTNLDLFVKGDYDRITELQKNIRNNKYTTIRELNNNINNLINFFISRLENRDKYIEQLQNKLNNITTTTNITLN